MTLFEIEEASNRITEEVDPDATIIFGSTIDDSLEGVMRITVVATGIEAEMNRRAAARPLRATNTNAYQMKKPVETTTETLTDSFVARYPEPSRHGSTSSSYSGHQAAAASTAQDTSYHAAAQTSVMPEAQPQQQAVASMEPMPMADTYTTAQEEITTGTVETEYVAEGATMRRVDVQPDYSQGQQSYNNVIPPFAPPRDQQVTRESSLTLNPPARHTTPAVDKETRKTPSLFDRITGRNRSHHVDFDTVETSKSSSDSSSNGTGSGMMSGLSAPRKTIVTSYDSPAETGTQGMLNIDAPKADTRAKQNIADDLEIPAFLRRQIS